MIVRLASILLLLLGLLNPVNSNLLDFAVGFFIFGFTASLVLNSAKGIILLVMAIVSWVIFAKFSEFNMAIVFGSAGGFVLAKLLAKIKLLEKLAVFIIIAAFLFSSMAAGNDLRKFLSRDLPLGTYNNDPGVFYKTYLLMEEGSDYYDAYARAQTGKFIQHQVPGDIWGWRMPTLAVIWQTLPGSTGLSIYFLYLAGASILLYFAFNIGQRYLGSKLGILSSYLLFPYLHFGARDQMFLETEWWSVMLFIIGVYFLITSRLFWATCLLSLTVLVREVYVLPIGLLFLYSIFKNRRLAPVFLIALSAFLIFFLYHVLRVSSYIDGWGTLFSPRTIVNGLFFIQQTLAFASWEYLLFGLRPFSFFLLASVAGCWFLIKRGQKEEGIIWLLAFLPFPISFLRFGSVPYNDYWGVIYVPLAIILAPIALGLFKKKDIKYDHVKG